VIPKIDSEIGILTYTTDFSGCGGTIRNQKDDFNVSELITESLVLEFVQNLVLQYTNYKKTESILLML